MSKLSSYVGQDFKNIIKSFVIKSGTSKEGNTYEYLDLELTNGFSQRLYINQSNEFGLLNALQSTNQQVAQNMIQNSTPVPSSNLPF